MPTLSCIKAIGSPFGYRLHILAESTPAPTRAQRGEAASAFTKNAINQAAATGGKFQVTMYGWDKFGGRVLGDILINGQSLRAALIANGFAREYYGEAKQSWCN